MAEPDLNAAQIDLKLAGHAYTVHVGAGLLDQGMDALRPYLSSKVVPIVADRNARKYHGAKLERALRAEHYEPHWFEPALGESAKSWQQLEMLVDWLLGLGIDRKDHIIAFGGGVIGDLTGFAAAILKRGCGFIQIPTTLLAQVDSSVGGKTAINARAGKNLVGAFHQPSLVLADTDCLATLPPRELRAGYAEVVKYGALGNAPFFAWLEAQDGIAATNADIRQMVEQCVRDKAAIVAEDERETKDRRALLNLGHTFGHALEAATGFSDRLLHGEAVAIGMVLAAHYSVRMGLMPPDDADRIESVLSRAGLPTDMSDVLTETDGNALVAHMTNDKKKEGRTLPFILLRSIGEAFVSRDVELADVANFLDERLA